MRKELDQLCRRIENEVAEIKEIRDLSLRRWKKALRDEDYLGSVAFDLHSFYQGVERIFEAFAKARRDRSQWSVVGGQKGQQRKGIGRKKAQRDGGQRSVIRRDNREKGLAAKRRPSKIFRS